MQNAECIDCADGRLGEVLRGGAAATEGPCAGSDLQWHWVAAVLGSALFRSGQLSWGPESRACRDPLLSRRVQKVKSLGGAH